MSLLTAGPYCIQHRPRERTFLFSYAVEYFMRIQAGNTSRVLAPVCVLVLPSVERRDVLDKLVGGGGLPHGAADGASIRRPSVQEDLRLVFGLVRSLDDFLLAT